MPGNDRVAIAAEGMDPAVMPGNDRVAIAAEGMDPRSSRG